MSRSNVERMPAERKADPPVHEPGLDARQRQERLADAVSGWSAGAARHPLPDPPQEQTCIPKEAPQPAAEPAERPVSPGLVARIAQRRWQIVKTGAATVVVFYFGWMPAQSLIAVKSTEAVVNARLVTIRSPIEGDVATGARPLELGARFEAGEPILRLNNARLDFGPLNLLLRAGAQIDGTMTTLTQKREGLAQRRAALSRQLESFRQARIRQITARVEETQAQGRALAARQTEAAAALERANALIAKGVTTRVVVEKAEAEARAIAEEIAALEARKRGLAVELESAAAGVFVGDSYNDTPQSAQRGAEMDIELADIDARLHGAEHELAALDEAIGAERRRLADLSTATVTAGVQGRVWEMQTAPGEHVNKGQDLLRLVDCSAATVTASLSERAYARLHIGQRATFRPRDGGAEFEGRVIALNGPTAVSANSAIPQQNLARDFFHASVKFPALAEAGECGLGRTGVVTFDTTPVPPTP